MSGCHPATTPSGRTARGKGLTVRIRLRTRRARLLVTGLLVSAPIGTAQSAAPAAPTAAKGDLRLTSTPGDTRLPGLLPLTQNR
jgi:hypothetical protein